MGGRKNNDEQTFFEKFIEDSEAIPLEEQLSIFDVNQQEGEE